LSGEIGERGRQLEQLLTAVPLVRMSHRRNRGGTLEPLRHQRRRDLQTDGALVGCAGRLDQGADLVRAEAPSERLPRGCDDRGRRIGQARLDRDHARLDESDPHLLERTGDPIRWDVLRPPLERLVDERSGG
jgi:hypothetical protein